ncbi:hypothetical protein GGF32_005363 [Allomyces javanicus]|nr:hypothetical protein GGF32_005363 [Allomyces javanicus]
MVSATADVPTLPTVQYQVERDTLDTLFAIHQLFVDLEAIRLPVRETWAKYRNGDLDLITASLVTNTALDWVRDAETTLIHERDHLGNPVRAMTVASYLFCGLRGTMLPKDLFDLDVVLDPAHRDVMEYAYVRTYMLCTGIGPQCKPLADFAPYDPIANRDAMTPLEQYSDDMNMLLMVAPPCFVAKTMPVLQTIALDVLSTEMCKFRDTKRMTMTLIFAAQVLLDTHHDLRGGVARGEQSLFAVHAQMTRSIKACKFRLHTWFCGHVEYAMHEIVLNMLVTPTTPWRTLLYAGQLYEACRQFALRLKARAFTSVLFRDRHVLQWIDPPQRSANFVWTVNQVASDLVATGTVDVTRFGPTYANFSGRSLSGVAERLGVPLGRAFPRGARIAPMPMLTFVRDLVSSEHELLRFDLLGMHVRCLNVLEAVIAIKKDKLDAPFGARVIDDMARTTGLAYLVGFLFKDWWFTTEEGARHYVKPGELPPSSLGMMCDATAFMAPWTRVHGGEAVAALAKLSESERAGRRSSTGQQLLLHRSGR